MKRLKIAVVCIGDELLKGFTVNTNLTDIGSELLQHGLTIDSASVIPDNTDMIKKNVTSMLGSGMDIIILTGGLGPTVDDLTKAAVADLFNLKLVMSETVVEHLKSYWKNRKRRMPDKVMNQALIPEGAEIFPNNAGTAPGLLIQTSNPPPRLPAVILLPGPPSELNPMFKDYVIPYLTKLQGFKQLFTNTIHTTGLPESIIEEKTLPLIQGSDCSVAYCASPASVKVYISGTDQDTLTIKTDELRKILGKFALPNEIKNPIELVIDYCKKNHLTLSVAESCTGGLIGAAITDIPGASQVFKGGIISYSNEWKNKILRVSQETLDNFGAVSSKCAEEMVTNLCNYYNTDLGIAVTGIAGPAGGTPEKPVGLVYISVKFKAKTLTKEFHFPGNRSRIRQRTLYTAATLLRELFI